MLPCHEGYTPTGFHSRAPPADHLELSPGEPRYFQIDLEKSDIETGREGQNRCPLPSKWLSHTEYVAQKEVSVSIPAYDVASH